MLGRKGWLWLRRKEVEFLQGRKMPVVGQRAHSQGRRKCVLIERSAGEDSWLDFFPYQIWQHWKNKKIRKSIEG